MTPQTSGSRVVPQVVPFGASHSGGSRSPSLRGPEPLRPVPAGGSPSSADQPTHPMKGTPMTGPQEEQQTGLAHPLPEGVSDTFVRPCLVCGITIHVVDGRERDHLHHVFEADESRAAYAWWQGYEAGKDPSSAAHLAHPSPRASAPNVPSVPRAREARYAEAIWGAQVEAIRDAHLPEEFAHQVRAVLPLVDAEVAAAVSEAQAERARLIEAHQKQRRFADQNFANWQSAEAEVERLREGIWALALSLDRGDSIDRGVAGDLRAFIAPSPASTTGEAVDLNESNGSPGWRDYRNWIAAGRPKDWKPGTTPTTVDGEPLAEWEVDLLARQVSPAPVSSGEAGTGDPNCVGLCGHGADPSACPSGCTEDASVSSGVTPSASGGMGRGEPSIVRHNHLTRDIKQAGQCPACDQRHTYGPVVVAPSAEGSE